MFRIIIVILLIVPIVEMWGLITVGNTIGAWPTILAVVATGVIGGFLAKQQGLHTWKLAQIQMRNGELPSQVILDGICIFTGGLLLLTPGFFTDVVGFLLLVPFTRAIIKIYIMRWFKDRINRGTINILYKK
ncbi:MAG: FxsA family protein [Bacilli bacterium]